MGKVVPGDARLVVKGVQTRDRLPACPRVGRVASSCRCPRLRFPVYGAGADEAAAAAASTRPSRARRRGLWGRSRASWPRALVGSLSRRAEGSSDPGCGSRAPEEGVGQAHTGTHGVPRRLSVSASRLLRCGPHHRLRSARLRWAVAWMRPVGSPGGQRGRAQRIPGAWVPKTRSAPVLAGPRSQESGAGKL